MWSAMIRINADLKTRLYTWVFDVENVMFTEMYVQKRINKEIIVVALIYTKSRNLPTCQTQQREH